MCLNYGCIPSKLFLERVKKYGAGIDIKQLIEEKKSVIKNLSNKIITRLNGKGVKVINSHAKLLGRNKIVAANNTYTFEKIIIATGLKEYIPGDFKALEILTVKNIFDIHELPDSILIVGGGFTGLEMGYFFARAGCRVYICDVLSDLLQDFSPHIKKYLFESMKNSGVEFLLGVRVVDVDSKNNVRFSDGRSIKVDRIFISTGRYFHDDIGALDAGIKFSKFIEVDERMMTSIEGIYAVGDINGIMPFAHAAEREGYIVAKVIAGEDIKFNRYEIPVCVYTEPSLARIGITRTEAQKLGIEITTHRGYFPATAYGVIKGAGGIFEVVCDIDGYIIGAEGCGELVEELIHIIAIAIKSGLKLEELQDVVFAHPSMSEVIKSAISRYI